MLAHDLSEAERRIHQAVIDLAVVPAPTPEARELAIAELGRLAGNRREPLARVRAELQHLLSLRSDDVDATQGLRLAEAALARVERPDGVWEWQARERRRRRARR